MARVSILMRPEAGHITPTLRLAGLIRDRGHAVCYVTVSQFQPFFERLGFGCVTMKVCDVDDRPVDDIWNAPPSVAGIRRVRSWRPGDLVEALRRSAPDLLVCDVTAAGLFDMLPAQTLGCPVIALGLFPPMPPPVRLPQIVLCPIEFTTPDEPARQYRCHYCEPSVWRPQERSRADSAGFSPDESGRRVYCSLGTQSRDYAEARSVLLAIMAAFADLPSYQLLIAASGLYEAVVHEPRPKNVRVVPSVPQLSVLAQADLVITHGGIGTLKEAIMAAVPMIVIPFRYDQPANAWRVQHHGIGRACPPASCTPADIRCLVRDISSDAVTRRRAAAMSAIFWRRESESRAAHLLLNILSGEPLPDS